MSETKTLGMLRAVNSAIEAVKSNHAGLPEIVVVLGNPGKTKKGQIHGHFARHAWRNEGGEYTHEIALSGESLKRGAKETMGTIIHELAHAYCAENDIQDTSNNGRYHNKKFREVAESFGLVIDSAPTIGHSVTTVPDDTAALYADEIQELHEALVVYRDHSQGLAAKVAKKYTMQCPECKDPTQTTKKWYLLNSGKLLCSTHDSRFEFLIDGEVEYL